MLAILLCCCIVALIVWRLCRKPKGGGDSDGHRDKELSDVSGWSRSEYSERYYAEKEEPDREFPPGCPVDVNYNGEWVPARIVSLDEDGTYTVDWGEEGMITRGVHPQDVRERSEGLFCVGESVLAWHNGDFFPAVLTAHNPDGTWDVQWEDGTMTSGLTAPELRLDYTRHGLVPFIDEDVASPNRHLVGQMVDVFWNEEWSIGTVRGANPDGSVRVEWMDETYTDGVDPTLIRPVNNPIETLGFAYADPSRDRLH